MNCVDIPESSVNSLMLLCGGVMLLSLVIYSRNDHGTLDQPSSDSKRQNVLRTGRNAILILIWFGIITFCVLHRKELSAEEIAHYTPGNLLLAAIVMLALFALKSLSIVVYCGLLYAANGILFPLPAAIVLNLCGTVIMVTLPYLIGRKLGSTAVDVIRKKYPKAEVFHKLCAQNALSFSFLIRIARIPCDIASLYMGAVGTAYGTYLLGSILGLLPHTITYPIMGTNIRNIHSPEFLISLWAEIAYILITSAIYALYRKKRQLHRGSSPEMTEETSRELIPDMCQGGRQEWTEK